MELTPEQAERFWGKVRKTDTCWEWIGCRVLKYGQWAFNGKKWRVHRLTFTLAHGAIPEGLDILHSCNNPACCNPAHLRAGTHTENMEDLARSVPSYCRLTHDQVREIRRLYSNGARQKDLAQHYGVSRKTIYDLIRHTTYRTVESEA